MAETKLAAKLVEVMAEIGHVPKRGRNTFHGYDYATEADIVDAVREKLAARNVLLLCSVQSIHDEPATTPKGKPTKITTAHMTFTFHDADSQDKIELQWAGRGEDPSDKGLYKALTGAIKYFLMKSFLMPTGDDPEASASEGPDDAALKLDTKKADGASGPSGAAGIGGTQNPPGATDTAAPDYSKAEPVRMAWLRSHGAETVEELSDKDRRAFYAWASA